MSEDGEDRVVHIEKTDDEEEINARNEVSISLNDSTNEFNKNANITVKSKDKDVPDLMKISLEALERIRNGKQNKDNKTLGHIG